MKVYEYFILKYNYYLVLKAQFDQSYENIKKKYEENESEINLTKEDNCEKNKKENEEENKKEKIPPITDNNPIKTSYESAENPVEKNSENKIDEKLYIINYLFKKLSLFTHPDKTKEEKLIKLFRALNKNKEDNDFCGIFFILLTFPNEKIRNNLLQTIEKKCKLFKILENEINLINRRIQNIQTSLIWNCYYNPNDDVRKNAQEKLWILISNKE